MYIKGHKGTYKGRKDDSFYKERLRENKNIIYGWIGTSDYGWIISNYGWIGTSESKAQDSSFRNQDISIL